MQSPLNLHTLRVSGFKSYHPDTPSCQLGLITIMIGPNGVGKSNLIAVLKMIQYMLSDNLREYVIRQGGADTLLFEGLKNTDRLELELCFKQASKTTTYTVCLMLTPPNQLAILYEKVSYQKNDAPHPKVYPLKINGDSSGLLVDQRTTSKVLRHFLESIKVYQFHDTSPTAKIRIDGYVNDNRYLRDNAGNLAAFLYRMKGAFPTHYDMVVDRVRAVMPQFKDFLLEPLPERPDSIRLNWSDRANNFYGPHQLSDGTLRFAALSSLLLQPPAWMPAIIAIDEPELGLHPAAIARLAGMMRYATGSSQVIVSTQSAELLDEFDEKDVVVLEWDAARNCTIPKRLNADDLKTWLEEYSLSELWQNIVLGGPAL